MFSYRDVMGAVDLQGVHRLGGYYVKCMLALLLSGLVFASRAYPEDKILYAVSKKEGFYETWKILADDEYQKEQQGASSEATPEEQKEKDKEIGKEIGAEAEGKYYQGRLIVTGGKDGNIHTSLVPFTDSVSKIYRGTTKLIIKLDPDLSLNSATFGDKDAVKLGGEGLKFFDTKSSKSSLLLTLNSAGLSFIHGPSITNLGIDAAGRAIDHVGEKELKEGEKWAATTGQLYEFDKRLKNLEAQDKQSAESPSGKATGTSSAEKKEPLSPRQASVTLVTRDDGAFLDAGDKVLRNIGAGKVEKDSSDAVTGAQLFHVQESLHGEQEKLRESFENLKKDLSERITGVDERASRGIASAMASAGLPQAYLPGKSMIAAATANYRGEQALSIGASTISENGNWVFKGTVNANRKDAGFSLGLGYQF